MTKVLVHELARQAPPLVDRLRRVLAQVAGAEQLAARAVIEDRNKPRMVLVGQFSSGKSTLIKALTDGAVDPKIDADIATDEVTEYPWDGEVILVDTPGVQSGLREHDELAWDAIGKSDFILFAVTVSLFDDAGARFIQELAHKHKKFDQMIVVITKASTLSATTEIRRDAVLQALGTVSAVPPIREVDSVYYLRSLSDDRRREQLRGESGIDDLRADINRISDDRGELAVLRQPFQMVRQLCDEAQALLVDDPHQRMALSVLAAQRKTVTERRALIDTQFRAAEARFKSGCLSDVVAFVDLAMDAEESGGTVEVVAKWDELLLKLSRRSDRLADEVNLLTEQEFDKLATHLGEIDGGHRVAELLRFSSDVTATTAGGDPVPPSFGSRAQPSGQQVGWARDVGAWLKQGRSVWGAGSGVKASSGTFGHQAVKEVGHLFGAKFKPWQAARIANNIGKAANIVGIAVSVGTTAYQVWRAEEEAVKAEARRDRRRSAFVTELMAMADDIATDARAQLNDIIAPVLDEVLGKIDGLKSEILTADQARTSASAELDAIATQADRFLAVTPSPKVIDLEPVDEGGGH